MEVARKKEAAVKMLHARKASVVATSVMLALALGLGLGACNSGGGAQGGSEGASTSEGSGSSENDGTPNPVVDYPTLADACVAAGYEMSAPDELVGYDATAYDYIDEGIIQVIYGDEGQLTVRKGADETDVSGVYDTYISKDSIYVNDVTVTCQGDGGTVSLVTWVADGHFFSAYSTQGLTMDEAYEIASSVK